jgi:hypothetical protein
MEGFWKRAHSVHPYLEGFETFNKGKRVKVVLKCLSVDFSRGPFDPSEDIRRLSETDQMGEMILMGTAGEAYIHLHQVEFQLGSDKKIDSEIHSQNIKKQVLDLFFLVNSLSHETEAPFLLGRELDECLNKMPYICKDRRTFWPPS